MSLNRWKVLACTLTVGVGGLAVFATDPAPKSDAPKAPDPLPNLTVKPTSPANGADTPAPVRPAGTEEFEITLPVPPAPAKAEEPARKPDGPVFEPVDSPPPAVLQVKGEADAKEAKKPEPTKKDEVPAVAVPPVSVKPDVKDPAKSPAPVVPVPDAPKPPEITIPNIKPPVPDLTPEPPAKPTTPTIEVPGPKPDVPPVVVTPTVPAEPGKVLGPPAKPTIAATPKPADAARLKLLLRMGDGQPRFEIRGGTTTDLLLKVYGEKIEMQAPPDARSSLAGVTAIGRVRFTAPGIEGTCDHLRILSATGEVLLEGTIHLKTKHGKAWSEMTAEKMVYQIGTSGLTAPGTSKVTAAGYVQD